MHQNEFEIYYQPIVSLTSEKILELEALSRWQHPTRGLIYPAEFLGPAEESGMIVPLGWWLLDQVCRQLRRWQDQFGLPTLRMSLNLSRQQFFHPDLLPRLEDALIRYGLPGECLSLEIKEEVVIDNQVKTTTVVHHLRERHMRVCIDDVGHHDFRSIPLDHFSISTLKIDRHLIRQLEADGPEGTTETAIATLNQILKLGQDMGAEVIAQGIETPGQLQRLKAMGFTAGQGYYFAKPTVPDRLEVTLARQHVAALMGGASGEPCPQARVAAQAIQVLVIEPDRAVRIPLKQTIEHLGYTVIEAETGQTGVAAYETYHPCLVMVDADMPDMDGVTCCQRLHQVASLYRQPCQNGGSSIKSSKIVMMVSASDAIAPLDQVTAAGATDYISKPIHWADLSQRLQRLLP